MSKHKLNSLEKQINRILKDELVETEIKYDLAEAKIYNIRSVGIKGDKRAYGYIVEIGLKYRGKFIWESEFFKELSTRITNEIEDINRVVCAISNKEK